ncbi:MAG: glycosyltransferase, partial [bacterium]|nr:glycosyltransferase [bacterium]
MKLLSLAQVDMSKTNACVVHPLDLAQGFRQNGISTQVIVISPRPALVKEKDLKVYVLPRWLIFPGVDNVAYNIMAWFILLFKSHSYDVIYVRQNFNLTIALWFIPWRNPVWLEVNGIFEDEEQFRLKNRGSRLKLWLGSFLERLAYQKADQVFCVTPQLKEKITGKNINPEKITVISNGVDIDKYYPMDKQSCKQKLGLDAAAIYIGFIGNISGWCGVDMLLRSLAGVMERYSQFRAFIGGYGEYLDEYIALAETMGLAKKVRFVG